MAGRSDAVREANIFRVLETIKRSASISRGELGRRTRLAAGTISEAVAELERRGLVAAEPSPERRRGRPSSRLSIEPEALKLGGFSTGRDGQLHFVITNARGEIGYWDSTPLRLDTTDKPLFEALKPAVDVLKAVAGPRLKTLDAIGFALPGLIDTRLGLLHWTKGPVAPPTPIAALLSAELGRPVFVENVVNARARAERLYGHGRDVADFAVITPNLGMGQYVRGELWTGPRGLNPEFRHTKIGIAPGPRCDCGATGCLGTYTGTPGLVTQGLLLTGGRRPALLDFEPLLDDFLEKAEAGDAAMGAVFEQAGHILGLALANLVNLHDPERIVVLGLNEALLEALRPSLAASLPQATFPPGRTVELVLKVDDRQSYALGAVALAFERALSPAETV